VDHRKSALFAVILWAAGTLAHAGEGAPAASVDEAQPLTGRALRTQLAIGAPLPLELGLEYRCEGALIFCSESVRYFAMGGYFRYPFFSSAERVVRLAGARAGLRVDLLSWLYTSGTLGYRYLSLTASMETFKVEGENLASSATLSMHGLTFQPALGMEWSLGRGWSLGFELGAQFVFASWGAFTLEGASDTSATTLRVDGAATPLRTIAGLTLPAVSLIKLSVEL
jgi:hypothetical protein